MLSFQAPVYRHRTHHLLQTVRRFSLQSQLQYQLQYHQHQHQHQHQCRSSKSGLQKPLSLQPCLSHSGSPLIPTGRARANHTIAAFKLADQSSNKQGHHTPPPPSRSSSVIPSATHFRHNNSANAPLLSSSSSPSVKIASQRSAQIARHLSSSAPVSSIDQKLHRPSDNSGTMAYSVRKVAAPNTLEHRVYVEKDGVPVSPSTTSLSTPTRRRAS
ncbi:Inorganic pyrophosphatase [Apiospora arundinis]